jgi:molybdenum cofactor synthesis domain-containing protein
MSNPNAAILIIGNEILSGRTQDANIPYLSRRLGELGIAVREARIIADLEDNIIETIRQMSSTYDYVFSTGGIGGTHDDITAAAMAKAFDLAHEPHPDAMKILEDHYGDRINEARRRMAWMPTNAELIPNPVSRAPGFQVKNVFVLAGVPSVMQGMFESLIPRLNTGKPYRSSSIRCELLENNLAIDLEAIQTDFPSVDIGSYPFFGINGFGTSIVLRGTDLELLNQATHTVEAMIINHGGTPERE